MKFRRSAHSGKISFFCTRLIVALVAGLAPTVAPATDETFDATLTAAQVVPSGASTSTATGFATFVFDTSARSITTDLSWVGLTGPTDRGHIHDGSPGALSSDIFFHDVVINGLTGTASNFGSPVVACAWGALSVCREATGFVHDVFDMPAAGDPSCPVYDNCNSRGACSGRCPRAVHLAAARPRARVAGLSAAKAGGMSAEQRPNVVSSRTPCHASAGSRPIAEISRLHSDFSAKYASARERDRPTLWLPKGLTSLTIQAKTTASLGAWRLARSRPRIDARKWLASNLGGLPSENCCAVVPAFCQTNMLQA